MLDELRDEVHDSCNSSVVAKRLWENRTKNRAFAEIRGALTKMAHGNERCMYCNASEAADIDHFRPLSLYPGHAFVWENYLLACSICNSHRKGDRFPLDEDGQTLLINPTWDDPAAHLDYSVETGRYGHIDRRGEVSNVTFGLNRKKLPAERMKAWRNLGRFLRNYDSLLAHDNLVDAEIQREDILQEPHGALLVWLLAHRDELDASLREILDRRPEIAAWVAGW